MRWTKSLGVALLLIGLLLVVFRQFGYTSERESAEIGPLEVEVERRERLPVPVWVGVAMAAAGGILLLVPGPPRT